MEYLIPLAIFAALGILAGVLLTVASKVFAVEVDERVDAIRLCRLCRRYREQRCRM